MKIDEIFIIRDTREKDGWHFNAEIKKPGKIRISGTKELALPAGDYTIDGLESQVAIERKAGFAELFGNLMNKTSKERFERELEKLSQIKYKYIIVESSLNNDLWGSTLPQFKGYGPSCSKIVEYLINYQIEFGINIIFAGDCGQKIARKIFEEVVKRYNNE